RWPAHIPRHMPSPWLTADHIPDHPLAHLCDTLTLSKPRCSVAQWRALFQSLQDLRLTTLVICASNLGVSAAGALARSPHLAHLTALEISSCQIGDAGAR